MKLLNQLYDRLGIIIPKEILFRILFDMNKYFEKDFTKAVQSCQKRTQRVFNTIQRKELRKYFYYETTDILDLLDLDKFDSIFYSEQQANEVLLSTFERLQKYDPEKILKSIIKRYENLKEKTKSSVNMNDWLQYYQRKREKEFDYSLCILRFCQEDFKKNNFNENFIYEQISKIYSKLENYRHLAIIFDGNLYDSNKNLVTWSVIFKVGIYCENFLQFIGKFPPFHKDQQTNDLFSFIKERTASNFSKANIEQFYNSISYGFKFEDCYISEDCSCKFLIFKKIELDNRPVPCPSCMSTIQSSNSYPEVFLHSWECKNENCPDRSKSGRGKRFDEYGTYRFFKLVENDPENCIDPNLYKTWKRDVYPKGSDVLDMLINIYSWANESIGINYDIDPGYKLKKRKVIKPDFKSLSLHSNSVYSYNELPVVVLLKKVNLSIKYNIGSKSLKHDLNVINGDSTSFLQTISPNIIGAAVTSPPYYNAREYSQWPTLIMYLIDMMANAKSVYNVLDKEGTYLYNIGDIVSEDNVFVRSNMSKKRLQLGFLSCMIFEIVGFKLNGNIIWDKGEVQSKRNSTVNLNAGYIKCINCYEHIFVFQKKNTINCFDKIARFNPVIKINCKGENIYKHTAPYPLELVSLVRPFIIKNKFILDPFLGSGTTLKWCKQNGYKGLGIELGKDYYDLCLKNIFPSNK